MRIIRILLVLVFLAVLAVHTVQDMTSRASTANVPPTLTCDSELLEISVLDGEDALRGGVTASDPQDGDLTHRVLVSGVSKLMEDNTARVTYVVFDSDDNMASLTRTVRYTDYRLPRFSLEEPLLYAASESIYLLDRLHASDTIDGDMTSAIRVSQTAGTDDPEIYTIDAQVTNSMGDTAWLTLPVIILDGEGTRCQVTLSTYLVYLEQGSGFNAGDYLLDAQFGGNAVSLDNVSVSGAVDTATPGTYYVRYTCTYQGNTGTAILTVVVE